MNLARIAFLGDIVRVKCEFNVVVERDADGY
jgi:hypothetical protein